MSSTLWRERSLAGGSDVNFVHVGSKAKFMNEPSIESSGDLRTLAQHPDGHQWDCVLLR
jgi:hypothetical protein